MGGRCVHGQAALVHACNYLIPADDPDANGVRYACEMVWHGENRIGDPCDAKRGKLDCTPSGDLRMECGGTCYGKKLLLGGDDCDPALDPRAQCADWLRCLPFGGKLRCSAKFHPVGGPCNADFECALQSNPDYYPAYYCGASEVEPTKQTCRVFPGEGEPCAPLLGRSSPDRRCARGSKCDTDRDSKGVCTAGKAIGASCTENADCASGRCYAQLICVPGTLVTPFVCNGILESGYGGLVPVPVPPGG